MSESIVSRFITALQRLERTHEADELVHLFSEEAELESFATGVPLQGRAGTWRFWRGYLSMFKDVKTDFTLIRDFVSSESGAFAVLEWVGHGHLHSGRPFSYKGVTLLEIGDGAIRRFRSYYDSAVFLKEGAKHQAA